MIFLKILTHLFPIHPFSSAWKHKKIQGFLMFSGGTGGRERVHWEKMG